MGCGSSTEGSEPTPRGVQPQDTGINSTVPLDDTKPVDTKPTDQQSNADSDVGNTFSYLENVALFAHNHFRELHHVAPVKLNAELSQIADTLAKRMARSEQHDPSPPEDRMYKEEPCGENLLWKEGAAMPVSGDEAVKTWYAEKDYYDYSPQINPRSVHFTQLVWAGTKEIGVGSASSDNGTAIITVYYPAGNIDGQYAENVKQDSQRAFMI